MEAAHSSNAAQIGVSLGHAERRLDEAAADFADSVEQYLIDLVEGVAMPEAQLAEAEFHAETARRAQRRVEVLREELAETAHD
jgi:hypothetical protein